MISYSYDDPDNTKKYEQLNRYRHFTPQTEISTSTPVYGNPERFIDNAQNKKLIIMLATVLQNNNYSVRQSSGDACLLNVQTSIEVSEITTIATHDIDFLVQTFW